MTTANNTLRVTELDFVDIKNNLKNFLRSQSQFQDFDFEGSGMNILLDVLAYNTHYMSYYLNMTGNEMFLDTAQLRQSVISHSKNLNYIPATPHGALVKATIQATPSIAEDQTLNVLTIEKYTKFYAQDLNGVNYPFVTLYSNTAAKNSGSFVFANTMLKQGQVVTYQYFVDATNDKRRFEIPSSNVDGDTIVISVQESSSNTSITPYAIATDITEVKGNSSVYFLEENTNGNYTFYFGDGIIGKKPKDGNIVIATYLETAGSVANNISTFFISDSIGGQYNDNVQISASGSSYGGTDRETVEQVRFRAPYYYTTQNRAVTRNDYETLITKDYNNIDAVSIWGGEDNDPPVYGKVYLSLKTKGNYALTTFEKEQIKNDLIKKRNILTVTPEIIDPDYVFVTMKGTVYYNPTETSYSSEQIESLVKASIEDYNGNELNTFKSTFRKSKLQNYLENADPSITGSDISIYVQKRIPLVITQSRAYSIPFNMPLQKGDFFNKMFTSPEIQGFDNNGVSRQIYFEETPQSATGVDSIQIVEAGYNFVTIPTVTISGDGSGATAEAVIRSGKIDKINITNRGSNYNQAFVTITGDGIGAQALAKLQAKNGKVRSYYFNSNGERVIVNENAGTVDYETGLLYLNTFRTSTGTNPNQYYNTDVFTVNFPLEREIIQPLRNRILSIDNNDPLAVQLKIVAES